MLYVKNFTGSPVTPPPENRPSQQKAFQGPFFRCYVTLVSGRISIGQISGGVTQAGLDMSDGTIQPGSRMNLDRLKGFIGEVKVILNSSPLNIDPWNFGDSYWKPSFLRAMLVLESVH